MPPESFGSEGSEQHGPLTLNLSRPGRYSLAFLGALAVLGLVKLGGTAQRPLRGAGLQGAVGFTGMPGAPGDPQPADDMIQELIEGFKDDVPDTLANGGWKADLGPFKAMSYCTQVVAGMNYFVKVAITEEKNMTDGAQVLQLDLYKPLGHNPKVQLTSAKLVAASDNKCDGRALAMNIRKPRVPEVHAVPELHVDPTRPPVPEPEVPELAIDTKPLPDMPADGKKKAEFIVKNASAAADVVKAVVGNASQVLAGNLSAIPPLIQAPGLELTPIKALTPMTAVPLPISPLPSVVPGAPVPGAVPMPGVPFGNKPATDEVQALVDGVKEKVPPMLQQKGWSINLSPYEAKSYCTQVVAGLNYIVKVSITPDGLDSEMATTSTNNVLELTIYKPPGNDSTPTLAGAEMVAADDRNCKGMPVLAPQPRSRVLPTTVLNATDKVQKMIDSVKEKVGAGLLGWKPELEPYKATSFCSDGLHYNVKVDVNGSEGKQGYEGPVYLQLLIRVATSEEEPTLMAAMMTMPVPGSCSWLPVFPPLKGLSMPAAPVATAAPATTAAPRSLILGGIPELPDLAKQLPKPELPDEMPEEAPVLPDLKFPPFPTLLPKKKESKAKEEALEKSHDKEEEEDEKRWEELKENLKKEWEGLKDKEDKQTKWKELKEMVLKKWEEEVKILEKEEKEMMEQEEQLEKEDAGEEDDDEDKDEEKKEEDRRRL